MKTMALETQTPELQGLAALIAEYWAYLAAIGAAVGSIFTLWRRYVKKRVASTRTWWKDAVNLPRTLIEIKNELQFENGISLRQKLLAIGQDLFELKRVIVSETAARRAMLQAVEAPIFECNESGALLWANAEFLKVTQKGIQQILGSNWRNIIALPDREEFVDGWQRAITEGTDFNAKFRLARADDEVWMNFEAVCVKDDLGNVVSYLGGLKPTRDPRLHTTES